MIKLDVNRKGHHKKTFVLDPDMAGIRYEPSKKNSRCKLIASGNSRLQVVVMYISDHLFGMQQIHYRKIGPQCVMC